MIAAVSTTLCTMALATASAAGGRGSAGCGKAAPVPPGVTTKRTIEVDGLSQLYLLHLPASYEASRPIGVVVSHGGWGVPASSDERYSGLSEAAEREGSFAVAYVRGYADNSHPGSRWTSFNTIGSVSSSAAQPTCLAWSGSAQYCYESCRARPEGCDAGGCDWTTCVDSTATTSAVLDELEATICVDTAREYATGQSNGGMFSLQLGVALSSRLAAIAPISATFTYGRVRAPSQPVPVLVCSGVRDQVIPVNATDGDQAVSSDGWLYAPLDEVFDEWRRANGCARDEPSRRWPTPLDGVRGLYCWGPAHCEAPVVRCAWDGAHQYFAHAPSLNGQLVWSFLSQFSKDGPVVVSQRRTNHTVAAKRRADAPLVRPTSAGPYGEVCDGDLETLDLSDDRPLRVCAPPCDEHLPCPPTRPDAPRATPTCLFSSTGPSSCVLSCAIDRDDCPPGSVCVSGYFRDGNRGACAFPDDGRSFDLAAA